MVNNNKRFFQNNTPSSDPGDIDPEDRSFLNYARNARNSTIPSITPDVPTETSIPINDPVNPQTQQQITDEADYITAPDFEKRRERMELPTGIRSPLPYEITEIDKNDQLGFSTFKEITNVEQIFKQIDDIVQTEKPNLPQNTYDELVSTGNRYREQVNGFSKIDMYEAGQLYMDDIYIALGRRKPKRIEDENANVKWRETWQNTLKDNSQKLNTFESFGGELAFNDFKRAEGIDNAPRAILETIFLTQGLKGSGKLLKGFFQSPALKKELVRIGAYKGKGFIGTIRPKNWFNYSTLGKIAQFEMAEERYLIPYATGMAQYGYYKRGFFNPEEEKIYEQALLAHKAEFADRGFSFGIGGGLNVGDIASALTLPFLVNTANLHSAQKSFLEDNITGTQFLGVDVEPGEVLGFFTGIGLLPNVARGLVTGVGRLGKKILTVNDIKKAAKSEEFIANSRMSELPDDVRIPYMTEAGPLYIQKVQNTFGQKGILDLPNQLSNMHRTDTRIINTPEDTYKNVLDPQMPVNKELLDTLNRVWDDIPENMTPVQRLEMLSNPAIRSKTNWQNTIYWNTHQNAKNEIISTSHKLTKPLKETETELAYRVSVGEDPVGVISQEHLSGFGSTNNATERAVGANILNSLGYQTASDTGIKGGEGHRLELINVKTNETASSVNDITDRTFHSYEEPETDYQIITSPVISNSFDALDSLRIIKKIDDNLLTNDYTTTYAELYNSWFNEYAKITNRKKIKDPKTIFNNTLRLSGLDELIGGPKTAKVKFSTVFNHLKKSMVSYEVRINDTVFYKDDGTVLNKQRFSKARLIGGKKVWQSNNTWIRETPDGKYDVIDFTDKTNVKKISTELTLKDAKRYAEERNGVVLPNILTGEMKIDESAGTALRFKRSQYYNRFNTLGFKRIPNDEKVLNLVHKYEDLGLYKAIENVIEKNPNTPIEELLTAKGSQILDQSEMAKYQVELEKYKLLKSRQAEIEDHFGGFDATGLGWARIKTVTQPDGTKAMSVSEIQSWKSSRMKKGDVVSFEKTEEWDTLMEMVDRWKDMRMEEYLKTTDQYGIVSSQPGDFAKSDAYKNGTLWDHIVKNEFWVDTSSKNLVSPIEPWSMGYMKSAPGTPKLNTRQFNQNMAKMIVEYAMNNGHTRILFDDSATAVLPSVGVGGEWNINALHKIDINGILYHRIKYRDRDRFEIYPTGLNKNNNFTTISDSDWSSISAKWNVLNERALNPNEKTEMNTLINMHKYNPEDYSEIYKQGRMQNLHNSETGQRSRLGRHLEWIATRNKEYYEDIVKLKDVETLRNTNINPLVSLEDIEKIYGSDIASAIKTNEMTINPNQLKDSYGSINIGKYPGGTNMKPGEAFRNQLEGTTSRAYSKILYKTNFASEATNANAYVQEVKDSVPYFVKKFFTDMEEYKGSKVELVTTKYDMSSTIPSLHRTDDPITEEAEKMLVSRTLLNDEQILINFKDYADEIAEEYSKSSEVTTRFIDDVIATMENELAMLKKEFPERENVQISNTMPTQEIYKKAFSVAKKKYNLSRDFVHTTLTDVQNKSMSEDDLYKMDVEDYYARQEVDPDDPFDYDTAPDAVSKKQEFTFRYEDPQHIDAITIEIDGKPLTMTDIENITDMEMLRQTKSGIKASAKFFNDGKVIINSYKNANVSDMFHEIGHVTIPKLKEFLDPEEYDNVLNAYGVKNEKWTRANHEKFADDFMDYLSDPNSGFWTDIKKSSIRRGFEYLISFFKRLFGNTANQHVGLSPEVKKFIYNVHKKVPDEGFSKFEKELGFPIDPQSRQIIDRIEKANARKITKLEKIDKIIKEQSSPEGDGKGKPPSEPYTTEYEDGDDSYKILYNHLLPNVEETQNIGLMRQLEGARNSILSKNEQWVKETNEAVYGKYKIDQSKLTTNMDTYGEDLDTLDLIAALHGEKLITDPALITKDMQLIKIGEQTFGIKTPISPDEARDSLTASWKRDMYNRVTVLRLEEELEMLEFFEDTFRAVDMATWDTVRLGFNAEIFFEKMMGIPNYFPRLWQSKAGEMIPRGRRVAGPRPSFTKGRANKTFIEMLIDNPSADYEGLIPSNPDPSIIMASRKIYGSVWRELQVMMNTLNKFNLMKTRQELLDSGVDQTEIESLWEVPKIGPTFEGMLVPGGAGDIAFTPEYFVPKEISTFLNNIYSADPDKTKVLIPFTNKSYSLNNINMFGKQVKVAFAPLQHIDMYYRAIASSTAGLIFETVTGGFITNPKLYGQTAFKAVTAPVSVASDIIMSNIPVAGKVWRNKISKQLVSDNVVNAKLKGNAGKVTFRMLEEQGAGVKGDRGIIAALQSNIKVFESANPDSSGYIKTQLKNLNKFMQSGLFEGTYRYTQMHGIKNYTLPYSQKINKGFTPEQHAAWAATYSNRQFSTLGLFQEVIKSTNGQNFFNLAVFSRIENQALISQGLGALGLKLSIGKGASSFSLKRAAFFQTNFLGFYLSFYVIGNMININAEINKHGTPKDLNDLQNNYMMKEDQMFPMQKKADESAWMPYEYNSKFMSPKIGYFGRNDLPIYLDQMGQMDTIFRFMDPKQAVAGRLGVPIQAVNRQLSGETFFGQPFENHGMRITQAVADISLPWMAQNGLNVTAQAYPKAQKYIPTSEKRLGVKGAAGQFFVNLRAMPNEQLRQYAIDQYRKEYVDSADTFLGVFPKKWNLASRKQKDEIFNKYPEIKEELKLRTMENNSLEQIRNMPEIVKGTAISEFTATMENERTRKQIGVIDEFVNDLGRFGSEAFLRAQLRKGSDVGYRKLEIFRDALSELNQEFYAGKDAIKIYNAMEDYEPEDINENTEAMTQYYKNMERFTSKESGIFAIEEWLKFRDEEFMPNLTEGQRTFVENNFKPSNVPYLDEFQDWQSQGYDMGAPRNYFQVKRWWQDKLKELNEFKDKIPTDEYLD